VAKPLTLENPVVNDEHELNPDEKLVPNGDNPQPKPPKGPNQADPGSTNTAARRATVSAIKSFLNILILNLLQYI
jgi:hypothetical protein